MLRLKQNSNGNPYDNISKAEIPEDVSTFANITEDDRKHRFIVVNQEAIFNLLTSLH